MAIEICNRECAPFRPNFTVFAILRHVGNTISPFGKGSRYAESVILVAYEQGSIVIRFCICSSGIAGVMQLNCAPRCPILHFLLLFAPSRDHPLREQQAAKVMASRTLMHGTKGDIKALISRLGSPRWPQQPSMVGPAKVSILPILAS